MEKKTWTITLANGKSITELTLNGNNFISKTPIDKAVFDDGLGKVIFKTDTVTEVKYNMKLVQLIEYSNEWWFILSELTSAELREQELQHTNKVLEQQVNALTGQNQFLEDCIAEMAGVVYA